MRKDHLIEALWSSRKIKKFENLKTTQVDTVHYMEGSMGKWDLWIDPNQIDISCEILTLSDSYFTTTYHTIAVTEVTRFDIP